MSAPPPGPGFRPPGPGSGYGPGYGPPGPPRAPGLPGPPGPGYGPPALPPGPPPAGYGRPPRRRGSANGVIAAAVAGAIIVLGTVLSVVLVTSDGNTNSTVQGAPSGSSIPSSARSQLPTGARSELPSGARSELPSGGGSGIADATAAGNRYFTYLAENLYYSSRGVWCTGSAFPLTQADVDSVVTSYALGAASGSDTTATMSGHVALDNGNSGTVTISLRPQFSGASSWCIYDQQ